MKGATKFIKKQNIEHLPLFTYGTLMKGFDNHWSIEHGVDDVLDATLDGYALFDMEDGYYPFMGKLDIGKPVVGQVIDLDSTHYQELMDWLDMLESQYNRIKVEVTTPNGKVLAWAYVSKHKVSTMKKNLIESNSWADFKERRF